MLKLNAYLFQNFVKYPIRCLLITFLIGVIFGIFNPFISSKRSNIPGLKEGFMIVFPTANLADPLTALKLRGQRVYIAHHVDGGEPCKLLHEPVLFSANERIATLTGNLRSIESMILNIDENDLKKPSLVAANDKLVQTCTANPKIIYGE